MKNCFDSISETKFRCLEEMFNFPNVARLEKVFYKIYTHIEEIDEPAIVKLLQEAVRVDLL